MGHVKKLIVPTFLSRVIPDLTSRTSLHRFVWLKSLRDPRKGGGGVEEMPRRAPRGVPEVPRRGPQISAGF